MSDESDQIDSLLKRIEGWHDTSIVDLTAGDVRALCALPTLPKDGLGQRADARARREGAAYALTQLAKGLEDGSTCLDSFRQRPLLEIIRNEARKYRDGGGPW